MLPPSFRHTTTHNTHNYANIIIFSYNNKIIATTYPHSYPLPFCQSCPRRPHFPDTTLDTSPILPDKDGSNGHFAILPPRHHLFGTERTNHFAPGLLFSRRPGAGETAKMASDMRRRPIPQKTSRQVSHLFSDRAQDRRKNAWLPQIRRRTDQAQTGREARELPQTRRRTDRAQDRRGAGQTRRRIDQAQDRPGAERKSPLADEKTEGGLAEGAEGIVPEGTKALATAEAAKRAVLQIRLVMDNVSEGWVIAGRRARRD